MKEPTALEPRVNTFGSETWTEKRERLDAEWEPLIDEKRRKVHGWALISEVPANMLDRTLTNGPMRWIIGPKAFRVLLVATRDGEEFGALPRTTGHATHEEAIKYARAALAQQGRRYSKKYGTRSPT